MEVPVWLKLESIVKKLNLSIRFNKLFNRENKKYVKKEVNIQKAEFNLILPIDIREQPEKISSENPPFQGIGDTQEKDKEIILTTIEQSLVSKINEVHLLCNCQGFDFEKNYKQALNHIRNKPSGDWYECAAKDMVLVKENIDFFSAFKEAANPEERETFNAIKADINYLYGIIQEIKHSNKRGNVQEKFLSPYDKRFNNEVMTEDKYEEIFDRFQKYLIEIFKKFELIDK